MSGRCRPPDLDPWARGVTPSVPSATWRWRPGILPHFLRCRSQRGRGDVRVNPFLAAKGERLFDPAGKAKTEPGRSLHESSPSRSLLPHRIRQSLSNKTMGCGDFAAHRSEVPFHRREPCGAALLAKPTQCGVCEAVKATTWDELAACTQWHDLGDAKASSPFAFEPDPVGLAPKPIGPVYRSPSDLSNLGVMVPVWDWPLSR